MHNYSRHMFKVSIALLLMSAIVMLTLATRTFVQERDYYSSSLIKSTQSTAREIELYVGGLRRALRIFATDQHELLAHAVIQSQVTKEVQNNIALHFPEQLAYALSKVQSPNALINEPELFGEHCRANMDLYAKNEQNINTGLSIHSSGAVAAQHFDVVTPFPIKNLEENDTGILFVSFNINDLKRLLQHGSSSAYTLTLINSEEPSKGSQNAILLSSNSKLAIGGSDSSIKSHYSIPIVNTPWILQGSLNESLTSRAWKASLIQAIIGTIALLVAGLTAWRSIEQEKVSHNRTGIVLNSVESERRRIARDLHDQVLSDVSHAKRLLMELEPVHDNQDSRSYRKLISAQRSVDEFSTTIRTAINELYPHTLENLGLGQALESYVDRCDHDGVELKLHFDQRVDTSLDSTQKLHTYRIVTELIKNSLSHSVCTKLIVNINQSKQSVAIRAIDNGKGFDRSIERNIDSHGIDNIESRAMMLGATYRWVNENSAGTCFELTIPCATNVPS